MWEKQGTIKETVFFAGKGLQTGRKVTVKCYPSPPGAGISFCGKSGAAWTEIKLIDGFFSGGRKRRSSIISSGVKVQTVEHFMSALWAAGIDNLKVEVEGPEFPAMDGSAAVFFARLSQAGREEQDRPRRYIKITEPLKVENEKASLTVFPAEKFSVTYHIDYPLECIKKEKFSIDLDDMSFAKEIAPARTFCLFKEAVFLLISGMGRGATFQNTLILGRKGPLKTAFRFPNEPVRHKILDLVGDMYMLGVPILGKFECDKSGHELNSRLLRKIHEKYIRQI